MGSTWWWALGLFVAGTAICVFRIPAGGLNALWAEDGNVFVTGALHGDFGSALLTPFNGYLHVVPRVVVGVLAAVIPLSVLPAAVSVSACAITAAAATLMFVVLRERLPSRIVRLSIWAAVVAMPVGDVETNGSIANAHWYLLCAMFAVLVTRWASVSWTLVTAAVVFLTITSDPLALVFTPLVLLQTFDTRTGPRRLVAPLAFFAGAALQVVVISSGASLGIKTDPLSSVGLLRALLWRVYLAQFAGEAGSIGLYQLAHLAALAVAGVLAVLVVLVSVLWGRQLGGLATIAFVAGTAFFLIAVAIRWKDQYDPALWLMWGAARYSVVPLALAAISLAAAVQTFRNRVSSVVAGRILSSAVLVGTVLLVLPNWSMTARLPTHESGAPWRASLAEAAAVCRSPGTPDDETVSIGGLPIPHFAVQVSCGELLDRSR
ncbi:hypothetical protein [Leifsonia sp. LS1]|uniref:hypothetical protein n=1 Tax=Leifsonia sp. LS1 TaxID=2828483 RepID=UPI001CFED18E|nr:hypothetical protein [Leifsonia sp. LS1]